MGTKNNWRLGWVMVMSSYCSAKLAENNESNAVSLFVTYTIMH